MLLFINLFRARKTFFLLTIYLFLNFSVFQKMCAQELPVQIPRITNAITLDGKVLPEEWGNIDTLSFVSHWPVYSNKANTHTLFRVAYDDGFIYFSAICYDKPELIQGPYFERDKWELNADQVAIFLDTYNDNENGVIFVVTPTGSRIDASIKNDAQGGSPHDVSWNSFWEASVSINETGWSVEARIPFSSLRFQPVGENVTMGLIAYRQIARERKMDIYPDIPSNWGFWSFVKASKAKDVTFKNIRNKRPWFTSPYLLAQAGHHHTQSAESPEFTRETDRVATVGLDVQHALTDNMNMDITVNTDFAQVEADDQIVNLSRFSFFFPEKRRFFLERSSIMEFGFENSNRLFYSRRIGINDGEVVPLWGGARIVGRIGNYDVGLLNMQSRERSDFSSENFGVLRLRRRVSKNNSYVGGILTSRVDPNGNTNLTYGLDGIINLFNNDYLKVGLARSENSADTLTYSDILNDRKRIFVSWENRSQVGFNYSLSYSQVDKNYLPGLGFEARNNFKSIGDRLSYGWFPAKRSSLRYLKFDLNATAYFPNEANRVESFLLAPSFLAEWVKNNRFQITFSRFYDPTSSDFNLSDNILIQADTYVNNDITVFYQTPSVNFLNSEFTVTSGKFYGGDRFSAGVTPTYTISKYLTLSGFYQYNQISFKNSPDYIAHVARLKIASSLNVKLSINAFAQLNSLTGISVLNFRLRYNWKDGNDLFIVYNETLNNNGRKEPYIPFSDYRSIILKFIYTFHKAR